MPKNTRIFAIIGRHQGSQETGSTIQEQNPYTPGDAEHFTLAEYKQEIVDEYAQAFIPAFVVTEIEMNDIVNKFRTNYQTIS